MFLGGIMNYCPKCGDRLVANAKFCTKCGEQVVSTNNQFNQPDQYNQYQNFEQGYANNPEGQIQAQVSEVWLKAATYEKISASLWMLIAVLQVLMAITGVSDWKILLCGVWNVYASICGFILSWTVKQGDIDAPDAYRDNLWQIIAMIVANVLIGGVIGVISGLLDLYVRHYVLENEEYFNVELETA